MRAMPTILFIIPYFGQWPFWMPFFIESCRANRSINWLLVSDCAPLDALPPNVEQRYVGFEEYCAWISQRLGFTFAPVNAYKLCDLKPVYGYLHEADLKGYDFWGFSDIDLVYGDLRNYFTGSQLSKYKFFSTHDRRVSGHLCLMRNLPEFRVLFRRIRNFKERLQDQQNHALDEGAFSRLFLWRKNFPEPFFSLLGRVNPLRRVAEFKEAFSTPNAGRPWVDGGMNFPTRWYWDHGRLGNDLDGGREFPYLHFLGWKKTAWQSLDFEDSSALTTLAQKRRWSIDAGGFHVL